MLKPLTISVLFWPCILLGETGSEVLRLKPAAKYIAEKGVLKPKEVLVWSGPEKPAAGWKRLDNQYFQIDYPDCYDIQTSGEVTDPKLSAVIELTPGPSCNSAQITLGSVVAWRPSNRKYQSVTEAAVLDMIYRQPLRLNGDTAVIFASVLDTLSAEKIPQTQLRWEAYVMCSGEMFSTGAMISPGKESHDRIEKNNYSAPEDFRRIASTFRCSKRRPPK